MGEKKYLLIAEVAEQTHCSVRHIHDEVKKKKLRAFKPGKCLLFDPEDVDKWIKKKAVS